MAAASLSQVHRAALKIEGHITSVKVQGLSIEKMIQSDLDILETVASFLDEKFEDGFFHADPHPGNLMVTDDMNLCIIDWGMVGRLTERDRFELIELLEAVVEKDSDALVHSLLRICETRDRIWSS